MRIFRRARSLSQTATKEYPEVYSSPRRSTYSHALTFDSKEPAIAIAAPKSAHGPSATSETMGSSAADGGKPDIARLG
jgi:hypothetical protein